MKILFDNSIHLGQFIISDEKKRIVAKNLQIKISSRGDNFCVGVESFNENSVTDDILWKLPQTLQDEFFVFMDMYHSVRNINRVPLNQEDAQSAIDISDRFKIKISTALTCAIAMRIKAVEIHSFYTDFQSHGLREYLFQKGIAVVKIFAEEEEVFSKELEILYQAALKKFREMEIDISENIK